MSALFIYKNVMPYNSEIHHRQSVRLKGYDYSAVGIYFVTICTQHRMCLFGNVIHDEMKLNKAGMIISGIWSDLPNKFKSISLDNYIIMPNHIHGLICIHKKDGKPLFRIIQYFKSFSSVQYGIGVKQFSWESFPGKLWQRNYYEHIVRDENSLNRIREYILNNPQNWETDEENPNIRADTRSAPTENGAI